MGFLGIDRFLVLGAVSHSNQECSSGADGADGADTFSVLLIYY